MSLTRARHIFKNFTDTVGQHPWLYGSMIFFACVGTVAAAASMQSAIDLLSQEPGEGLSSLITSERLSEIIQENLKGLTVEQICQELNSYFSMCNLLSADFVTVQGTMEISNCAEGEVLGHSENPMAMVCNAAKLIMKNLPQETLNTCAEMAKETMQTMGLNA